MLQNCNIVKRVYSVNIDPCNLITLTYLTYYLACIYWLTPTLT